MRLEIGLKEENVMMKSQLLALTLAELELAVKAMQHINKPVDRDILTVEQELQALGGVITDSHAGDLRDYCASIEDKVTGEYVRAGQT